MRPLRHGLANGSRSPRGTDLWWLIPAILAALGASTPEVVKVRAPSTKVANWFPPGTDLQILTYDRFEALVKSARERPPTPQAPRLVKARHAARWEAGRLVGRSELTVELSPEAGASLLILEPWSPALLDRGTGSKFLRATQDGRLGLKVEANSGSQFEFEWTLGSRPGSNGRAFALDLPGVDVSSLSLDLPSGLVPQAMAGPRVGPEPGTALDRSTWRFEAARGRVELRFRDSLEDASRANSPGLWLEGTTTVDLAASPINWRADWTLDESPGAPRTLTIGLDPGLEVVEVTGPRLASFRLDPEGQGSKVSIRLDGEGSGSSTMTIRAICQAPLEGTWSVPSARPLDATWTGGRTLVRLDANRVFQSCVERAGRRVAPRSADPAESADLIFEPRGMPGPVADLTFRKPTADATVEVRGLLRLGDDAPRIEVAMTWSVEKGRLLSLAADLPPGWTPDGVVSAFRQPIPWHAEPLGSGGIRVYLGPAQWNDLSRSITLTLNASAREAGVTGPLDLPRVRPAPGVRVVDEVWVATADPSLSMRPILGRGLAWLDPPDPPLDDIPTPWVADDLIGALAWRWLADDAEARIDRDQPRADPRGEAKLEAKIRSRQITLNWAIEVGSPGADLGPIPIHLDEPVKGPIRWKSAEAGGPIIEPKPIEEARRALLGFPSTGQAWELVLSGPANGRVQVVARAEQPWLGQGRIPLLTLPERYRTRGNVTVLVENSTKVKIDSTGLTAIEPPSTVGELADSTKDVASSSDAGLRKAGEFIYRSAGGRLLVETTEPRPNLDGGLIREAVLVSDVSPGAGMRHRLTMGIATDSARSIALRMPVGVSIDRLRRDGLAIAPTPSGDRLLVEVPGPGPGRPLCSLTIDYRTVDDPRLGPIEPNRLLPECSLPCLGFVWEIVTPEPWVLESTRGGLEATDPQPIPSMVSRLLGFHWSPWVDRVPGRLVDADASMLGDLDKAATEIADGETNLGDWILKLDAGRWPLVVDRLAIRSVGYGPGSRVDSSPDESTMLGPVRSVLDPLGLTAIPIEGMILITSQDEAGSVVEARETWSSQLRAVASEGSDATDRFQSATRWRGEATPRALAAGESTEHQGGAGRWKSWWVVSTGWPTPGGSVSLIDARSDRAWSWFVASIVLAAGFLGRDRSARSRALALSTIGVVAVIGLAWNWPADSSSCSGLLKGGLAVLAFWLGRSFRPGLLASTVRPSEVPSTSRRSGFVPGLPLALVLATLMGFGVASLAAAVGTDGETPILALLPFDGPADPTTRPDRVVLMAKDHKRLEDLAKVDDSPAAARTTLVTATHKVDREEPGLARVESFYEVEVEGTGQATWSIPVGPSLELSAEVDARPSPLAISPDGLSGIVTFEGLGRHRLHFKRLAPLSTMDRGVQRARLPINRAAFARVAVAKGGGPSWVEVVGAAGELTVEGNGVEGGLGPLDVLEVRWFAENRRPTQGFQGPIEAKFLWDARPSGDLIRMKMVHSDPEGASVIRVLMERGLMVRRYSIPNIVSIRIEGTTNRPEWVARVDPPLPKDLPIEMDFWRPAQPGTDLRLWPEIELPTPGKFSGLIGFRRSSDWSGRLEARDGIEPVSESSFSKAWGALPEDGLILAGTARYSQSMAFEVKTGPVPLRRSIKTRLVLDLVPGRLNALIEGVLTDRQGRSFELEVVIPNDLRIVRIEAAGLLDWRKDARDRLRLQFDGSEAADRKVRIEGYLPSPADDTVKSEIRTYQAKVPWPRWLDAEPTQGTIEVNSSTKFQFEPGEGIVDQRSSLTADSEAVYHSSYRIEGSPGSSAVRWSSLAPKVSVAVESELAIDPAQLTWTAVLTCDVSGGPADTLSLNLPTEWASSAKLEVEGQTHRLESQPIGPRAESTQWKIKPESPIWGRARLILRSSRPLEPGREFAYPQVAPLGSSGRGSVGRYDLAILNLSGRSMEVAGSSGIQEIDPSRLQLVDSSSSLSSSRSIDHAYHVTGERWFLRLKVGRTGDEASTSPEARPTRVAFAQLASLLDRDGETWGRARYELEPRPGPFLAVRLPEGAEVPWAAVDGLIGPAIADGPGRWLVPLGDHQPRRVSFAWHVKASGPSSGRRDPLAIPSLDHPAVSTLLSVEAPDHVELTISGGGVERIRQAGWQAENIEQLASRVVEALGNLDRSSRRDRQAILDDLTEIELRLRHVSRVPAGKDIPADPISGRLQAALATIAEASQAAGLDDLIQEARARVGVAPPVDDSLDGVMNWSAEILRIRRSGDSHFFRFSEAGSRQPATITHEERAPRRRWGSAGSWTIAGSGLLFWLAVGGLIARGIRPTGRLAMSLVLLTLLGILAWEPLGILLLLSLVGWGWISQ